MVQRVVITGMGVVCPFGNSPTQLGDALRNGRSGVSRLDPSLPDGGEPGQLPPNYGGVAREFTGKIDNFGSLEKTQQRAIRKGLKLMCRDIQMGVAAAQLALSDAGYSLGDYDPQRSGVSFGADYIMTDPEEFSEAVEACVDNARAFDFEKWGDAGLPKVTPLWLLKYLPNMPASHIAIYNDLRGPSNSITMREVSGNLAIAEAYTVITRGNADLMVAGAAGTRLHVTRAIQFALQEEISSQSAAPETASRPFDRDRSGMVLGEGGGAVVLESLEVAESRGANILGEVVGYGSSAVSSPTGVARREVALANAMRAALRTSQLEPEALGHIHAHGLATRSSDIAEAKAINAVFGRRTKPAPVTAAKSFFGNLGAGGGVVELIASIDALNDGRLFPVLNYETPDPECSIGVVSEMGCPAGETVLNVNVTPQGQASALVVRRAS